jgi:uncharacterized protein
MKTVCIYHSIDLDGWMSAAIVRHWFIENHRDGLYFITVDNEDVPEDINHLDTLTFIGYNYGQPIPDLSGYDKVIMCDISFPKEEMINIAKKIGLNFIWLDHHISAITSFTNSDMNGENYYPNGIRNTKFAACELTWQYFFPNTIMPEIVRLLGRYDCFGHKGTDEEQKVLEFQYGARSIINNYEEAYIWLVKCIHELVYKNSDTILQPILLNTNNILKDGKSIYKYLCTEAEQTYKNGFKIILTEHIYSENKIKMWYPRNFLCINKERFNPINFGIDYHKDGYDGVACFWYNGNTKLWHFSLYNDNGHVDCSLIAKQYGGGGHKGASGFTVRNLNEIF